MFTEEIKMSALQKLNEPKKYGFGVLGNLEDKGRKIVEVVTLENLDEVKKQYSDKITNSCEWANIIAVLRHGYHKEVYLYAYEGCWFKRKEYKLKIEDYDEFVKKFSDSFLRNYDELDQKYNFFGNLEMRERVTRRWEQLDSKSKKQNGAETKEQLTELIKNKLEEQKQDYLSRMLGKDRRTPPHKSVCNAIFKYLNEVREDFYLDILRSYLSNNQNKLTRRVFKDLTGINIKTQKQALEPFKSEKS